MKSERQTDQKVKVGIKMNKLGPCLLCFLVVVIIGVSLFFLNDKMTIKVDEIERTVSLQGKAFEQICQDTSGFWMAEGMRELREGVSVSIEKCSGCMPNSKNMFCQLDDYLTYIKENGVDTTNFKREAMK